MSRHSANRRRRDRSATAVLDAPTPESTGDTDVTTPALTVQTPESITVIWSQYLTAKTSAERAGAEAAGMEQHADKAQSEEDSLRARAAQLLADADAKKDERARLLNGAADWRREEHKQTKVAADLYGTAKGLAEASGLPDPEEHPPVPAAQYTQAMPQVPDPLSDPLPQTPAGGVPVAGPAAVDANALLAPPTPNGPAS